MSINVKNRRVEELVVELKRRTGKGTTDLFLDLLEREKERLDQSRASEIDETRKDVRRIVERWNARPLVDPRPVDEILAYDEDGLPT